MASHAETIRTLLAFGPANARQLIENTGISQPTLSRTLAELGDEVLRLGAARSIQYTLRDSRRGLRGLTVHRVDGEGRLHDLGELIPVRPDGFVMIAADGSRQHSSGLPWWLADMRPAGYLGRAYVARYGSILGLPARLADWSDTHTLLALLAHGHDLPGNLLLGEAARAQFLASGTAEPIGEADKAQRYPLMAAAAAQGERPGSSAGGEQPKFASYAQTPHGARHVLVKFSEAERSPVSERWRDLLLFEHLALESLRAGATPAARSRIIDTPGQRFLEIERFDRAGAFGRHALFSLQSLDLEFVGKLDKGWPVITQALVRAGIVEREALAGTQLLWAFGCLTGNTDMHGGNLSFTSDSGRPYALAPAYDMTAMAFAPRSGGGLPDTLAEAQLRSDIPASIWRRAAVLATQCLHTACASSGFSSRFQPCLNALQTHLTQAISRIDRLA